MFKWSDFIISSSLLYSIDVSLNCNLPEAEPTFFLAGVA